MSAILAQLRKDLAANADPQTQKTFQRFFKEQVKYYGVKTPTVGKIAKNYWKQVKTLRQTSHFRAVRRALPFGLHGRSIRGFQLAAQLHGRS